MKKNTLKIILTLSLLIVAQVLFAQDSPANRPPPPPGVPIDGGLIALVAVGAGYALKKLKIKK
ncbi:MAG: hypothetical protein V3U80_00790 [Flavobacteriaceae bacterium]